jgi:lipoprotein NlpD
MERMIRHAGPFRFFPGLGGRHLGVCFLLSFLALLLLVACANSQVQKTPAKGVYHIVKKGETLYSIARAYSTSLQDLAEINNIRDVSSIKEGSVIFVPDADQVIDDVMVSARQAVVDAEQGEGLTDPKPPDQGKPSPPPEVKQLPERTPLKKPVSSTSSGMGAPAAPSRPAAGEKEPKIEDQEPINEKKDKVMLEKGRFVWPVEGIVKTRFGIQPNKTYHNWIKIACPAGTRVMAAARGTVIFSANLKDFGETIIIRHDHDFTTVYTHLKKRYVRADQAIKKSQAIATVGRLDETGDAYFNFEIRLKGKARNPLFYLP